MWAGSNYSSFIMQYYGILRVWLPGTTQMINKKDSHFKAIIKAEVVG